MGDKPIKPPQRTIAPVVHEVSSIVAPCIPIENELYFTDLGFCCGFNIFCCGWICCLNLMNCGTCCNMVCNLKALPKKDGEETKYDRRERERYHKRRHACKSLMDPFGLVYEED